MKKVLLLISILFMIVLLCAQVDADLLIRAKDQLIHFSYDLS